MFVTVAGHFNNKVSLSTGKVKSVIAKYVYFLYLYSLPLTKDMKCVQLNMYSRPNLYCLWSALALSFRTVRWRVFFLSDPYFFPDCIPTSPLIQVLWRLVWWSNVKFDYNIHFHQMNQSTMVCFCYYLVPLMRDTLW